MPRKRFSMSLESWKSFFEIGGVILLFLTFVFGAGVVLTSTRINERQTAQLREFESKLTAARTELAQQQERAAKAEADAAEAKTSAANAEVRAAETSRKADEERIARLKIEAQLAPRRVSGEQETIMKPGLGKFKIPNISLFVMTGNPEVADFASDLERLFKNAGLAVDVTPGIAFGGNARGLSAAVGQNRVGDARLLAEALKAGGIISEPLPVHLANAQPDRLELTIAPK